mgnify:CR=1 FL=1
MDEIFGPDNFRNVSVLYREPKLLKEKDDDETDDDDLLCFSALP